MRVGIAAAALVAGLGAATAPASAYTSIYAFGDSLSDVGNLYTASGGKVPISPYYLGRFSNGPNWLDQFAAKLGVAVTPSATGGNDFAVGGAQTGPTDVNTVPSLVPFFDLNQQVQAFRQFNPSPQAGALYTLDIGANDIRTALEKDASDNAALTTVLDQAVNNTVTAVGDLFADGARDLLYYEVPDLSLVPAYQQWASQAGTLASNFNQGVLSGIAPLVQQGMKVFDVPTYADLQSIVADPAKYGFTNVSSPCFSGGFDTAGSACDNPDQYLFWDTEHPTKAANALVADLAYTTLQGSTPVTSPSSSGGAAVPEPANLASDAHGLRDPHVRPLP